MWYLLLMLSGIRNDTAYIMSNIRMVVRENNKHVEGEVRGQFEGTYLEYAWSDCEKPRK